MKKDEGETACEDIAWPLEEGTFCKERSAQYPVVEAKENYVFMTIGNDWAFRDYLFPGYPLSNTGDAEYALRGLLEFISLS